MLSASGRYFGGFARWERPLVVVGRWVASAREKCEYQNDKQAPTGDIRQLCAAWLQVNSAGLGNEVIMLELSRGHAATATSKAHNVERRNARRGKLRRFLSIQNNKAQLHHHRRQHNVFRQKQCSAYSGFIAYSIH